MSAVEHDDVDARGAFSDFGEDEDCPFWDLEDDDDPEGFGDNFRPAASDQQGSGCSAFAHHGHDHSPTRTSSRTPAEVRILPSVRLQCAPPSRQKTDRYGDGSRKVLGLVTFQKNIRASRSFTQTWTDPGSTSCRYCDAFLSLRNRCQGTPQQLVLMSLQLETGRVLKHAMKHCQLIHQHQAPRSSHSLPRKRFGTASTVLGTFPRWRRVPKWGS